MKHTDTRFSNTKILLGQLGHAKIATHHLEEASRGAARCGHLGSKPLGRPAELPKTGFPGMYLGQVVFLNCQSISIEDVLASDGALQSCTACDVGRGETKEAAKGAAGLQPSTE